MVHQGPPPPRSRRTTASDPRRPWRDEERPDDEEYPPWAGPGIIPRYADHPERERRRLGPPAGRDTDPGRRGRPPGRGRLVRGRTGTRTGASRTRRVRRVIWGGAVAIVVLILAGLAAEEFLVGHHPPTAAPDGLVTTFQPGEFKTVPNACSSVTTATLDQYLPGHRRRVVPRSLFGRAQSLCDWSVDAQPRYRVLQVTVQAYAPTGLASGNGSATAAATDAYSQARAQRAHPSKATHLPRATMTALTGLGNSAFAALQTPSAGGATTDMVTVVARRRNVLITVMMDGLVTKDGRYGPVSPVKLRAGAVAAVRDILAQLR